MSVCLCVCVCASIVYEELMALKPGLWVCMCVCVCMFVVVQYIERASTRVCVCVRVCVHVCVCERECMYWCVCVCMYVCCMYVCGWVVTASTHAKLLPLSFPIHPPLHTHNPPHFIFFLGEFSASSHHHQ